MHVLVVALVLGVASPSGARPVTIPIVSVAGLWVMWRCMSTKVRLGRENIVVHDVWHRRSVPWNSVAGFDTEEPGWLFPFVDIGSFSVVRLQRKGAPPINLYATAMLTTKKHDAFYAELCRMARLHGVPIRFTREQLTRALNVRRGLSWRRPGDWVELTFGRPPKS